MKKLLLIPFLGLWIGYAQSNGNELFDESYVHEVRITFEQEDFWDSLEYYYEQYLDYGADKQYMMASVQIDGNTVDSVGVRQKGYFSNWGSEGLKEPLKIDFNEYVQGKKYDGLKKINLQNGFGDPSMMRDALAYKFMRDAGIAAPRSSYAKVYLNDTYWGLYVVVEQVDNKFLKNWFSNNNGNLFKCIENTSLEWQGTSKSAYEDEFELKTNEELDEWNEFIDFVKKANNASEFEDSISTQLQMNNYLRVLAADVLMYNWDSYYEHGRNFYVYYDSTLEVFQWIPWDYNLAFSSTETNILITYEGGGGGWGEPTPPKPLVKNVMESDVYRPQYFNHLCIMVDNYFTLDNLEDYIDETKELISDALDEDPNKYFTISQFNTSIESDITVTGGFGDETVIPGLKSFITSRGETVTNQLSDHDHSCTTVSLNEEEPADEYLIYPNPSETGVFTLRSSGGIEQIQVYSMVGSLVFSMSNIGDNEFQLDLSEQKSGMYMVQISDQETETLLKIVKQ
jgi:hypothetical protein